MADGGARANWRPALAAGPGAVTRQGGLELRGVSHSYGSVRAVVDATLSVQPGEVVGLLGPSGCGKTTLLRVTAGLETLQQGEVQIAGRVVARPGASLPPEERGVGLVFQDYALFPHLTVVDNVAFGLGRLARQERVARALDVLGRVGLAELAGAYPHMLSGGQQQRVALARAVAPDPAVMLLDEPFAGLDRRLREQVRGDVLRLLREIGAAVLLVTHDPEEAMALSDRIVLLRAGHVEQAGTPADLYHRPATAFVARFLGETTVLSGTVQAGVVATPLGPVPAPGLSDGQAVEIHVRPERLRVLPPEQAPDGAVRGRLQDVRLLGAVTALTVEIAGAATADGAPVSIQALQMGPVSLAPGEPVAVLLDPAGAFVYAAS
ncbi:MAG: ABC transporter ATP-binding protein [Chloroflexota bacterium]